MAGFAAIISGSLAGDAFKCPRKIVVVGKTKLVCDFRDAQWRAGKQFFGGFHLLDVNVCL